MNNIEQIRFKISNNAREEYSKLTVLKFNLNDKETKVANYWNMIWDASANPFNVPNNQLDHEIMQGVLNIPRQEHESLIAEIAECYAELLNEHKLTIDLYYHSWISYQIKKCNMYAILNGIECIPAYKTLIFRHLFSNYIIKSFKTITNGTFKKKINK